MTKYLELSEEDYNFYANSKRMLEDKGVIGIHKYNELINKQSKINNWNAQNPHLTPRKLNELELLQIMQYEIQESIDKKASKENTQKYFENIDSPKNIETTKGVELNKSNLYHGFKQAFFFLNNLDFVETKDTIKNLEPVLKYFAKDESFFNCERLHSVVDGVQLNPSFEKGLLIVGNYGNGKSTMIKAFEHLFKHNAKIAIDKKWHNANDWNKLRFNIANCHDIVTEFEACKNPEDRDVFYKKYSSFKYSFDDIKKEKIASNFGLTNIMQSILEKRYDNKKITFITCNYTENNQNDLSKSLEEFGTKYGGHIYDRLFQMFNIIEFKGKSFRK